MENNNQRSKRYRRTRESLERDLYNAAILIIEKVGFPGLTVTELLKESKAEAGVFYNRYKDIDDFIDKLVRNFDYWVNDSISFDQENHTAIENTSNIMNGLIDSLVDNVCMQKIIAWELNDNNYITRRTAQNRDTNSERLIQYLENEYKDCEVNFNVGIAILIGGIYYLIIHRKVGTFCKVNFDTKEGVDALKKNIGVITKKIFSDYKGIQYKNNENTVINIAIKLIMNGVDPIIIQRSTGLSEKEVAALIKKI